MNKLKILLPILLILLVLAAVPAMAEEAEDLSLSGTGKIDCNGEHFVRRDPNGRAWKPYVRINFDTPPRVVFLTGCRHVRIEVKP